MKYFILSLLLLTGAWGCKSASTDNGGTTTPTNFTASDLLPLNDTAMTGRINGHLTIYDSLGNILEQHDIDRNSSGYLGPLMTYLSKSVRPVHAFDFHNNLVHGGAALGYIGNPNGNVIAQLESGDTALLLPKALSKGTSWSLGDFTSPHNYNIIFQVDSVLASYTNNEGHTFSNVVKINGTFSDNVHYQSYRDYGLTNFTESANGSVYLAKGIGVVGITLDHYEFIGRTYQPDYIRKVITGYFSRTE